MPIIAFKFFGLSRNLGNKNKYNIVLPAKNIDSTEVIKVKDLPIKFAIFDLNLVECLVK